MLQWAITGSTQCLVVASLIRSSRPGNMHGSVDGVTLYCLEDPCEVEVSAGNGMDFFQNSETRHRCRYS